MQIPYFITLLSLAAMSRAISITSPDQGTTWSSSGPNTMTWTSVNTDPEGFAVTLVQQGVYRQTLADNVSTAQDSLTIISGLPVGNVYQVNIVKSAAAVDVNTILAQSAQFNITQGSVTSTQSSRASTSSTGSAITGSAATPASSFSLGTDLPNASNTTVGPTKSPSHATPLSLQWHSGLLGIFVTFFGIVLV